MVRTGDQGGPDWRPGWSGLETRVVRTGDHCQPGLETGWFHEADLAVSNCPSLCHLDRSVAQWRDLQFPPLRAVANCKESATSPVTRWRRFRTVSASNNAGPSPRLPIGWACNTNGGEHDTLVADFAGYVVWLLRPHCGYPRGSGSERCGLSRSQKPEVGLLRSWAGY